MPGVYWLPLLKLELTKPSNSATPISPLSLTNINVSMANDRGVFRAWQDFLGGYLVDNLTDIVIWGFP